MMTTTPDEPRPVRVHLGTDVGDFVAAMRDAGLYLQRGYLNRSVEARDAREVDDA